MEKDTSATVDNVSEITSARSYRERLALEKAKQIELNREALRQYYREHPHVDQNKKLDDIAARGMYVIYGEKE
ncbi:MAG: hypothetical protein ABWX90_03950 [Candidatus Saccharimonadales bacterium]